MLARWIAKSRGVDASFRQLIVTSGAQQAFYLLIAACTSPGDLVAVEDPGYHRFRSVVEARGARVSPVPVDDEGIVVEAIPFGASVVYVTPSHQFPTGVTMSMSRRLALLELAEDHDMLVIEDDYDTEFRYVDRPLEPLYRLDRTGQVAYVASFSKTLCRPCVSGTSWSHPNCWPTWSTWARDRPYRPEPSAHHRRHPRPCSRRS